MQNEGKEACSEATDVHPVAISQLGRSASSRESQCSQSRRLLTGANGGAED